MTPNLRFNKKMTKKLIASTPEENIKKNKLGLDWAIENTNKIYGSCYSTLFGTTLFIIQKKSEAQISQISFFKAIIKFYPIISIVIATNIIFITL